MWNAGSMVAAPDELNLTAAEARVLGALLEKELTTPDSYPLTLNALTAACNQTSNRDPVVRYESQLVETTMLVLKGKGLARVVHPGSGERATKYRQVADEALKLEPGDLAVVCLLLLRGPQTVAELKARTERMHRFASGEIESVLDALTHRERGLVARVDRLPGQKEDSCSRPGPTSGPRRPLRHGLRPPAGGQRGWRSWRTALPRWKPASRL
jgi:uncharacterized protein YceH (UPF0502 family)